MLIRVEKMESITADGKIGHKRIMILRCDGCGAEYEKPYNKRIYSRLNFCTRECSDNSSVRAKKIGNSLSGRTVYMTDKECEYCSNSYVARSGASKYCSLECKRVVRGIRRRKNNNNGRICKHCSGDVPIKRNNSLYCSIECRDASRKERLAAYVEKKSYDKRSNKNCVVCGESLRGSGKIKFCSDKCFVEHRRLYRIERSKKNTRIINCKYCGKEHSTYKKATKFCSRSCGSKWYIENTDRLDAWRVVGADKISKGQRELYELLKDSLSHRKVFLERDIPKTTRSADILFEDCKTVVSFYGDFFHANPKTYNGKDVHPLKGCLVEEVWKNDKNRVAEIEAAGYEFLVVWESDFKNNKEEVLNRIMEVVGE